MKTWLLGGASAVVLAALPHAGWSLTPQEAWEHWQAQAESFGLSLAAASETPSGATLTLEDVAYTGDWGFVQVAYRLGTLTLSEEGENVSVAFPDSSTLSFSASPPDEESVSAEIVLGHSGSRLTVAREGDQIVETGSTPQITADLSSATLDGEPVNLTASYVLDGMDYTRRYGADGSPTIETEMTLDSVEGSYAFDLPAEGVTMSNTTKTTGLTSTGVVALGSLLTELQGDLASLDEAGVAELIGRVLDSGFRIAGTSSYATNSVTDETTNEFGTTRSQVDTRDGTGEVSLSGEGIEYAVTTGAFDVALAIPGVPLPQIDFSGEGGDAALSLPIAAAGETAPYALRMAMRGLSLGEPIWSMFDPSGVLPREPATLVLDLTGQVRWLADLFSAEAMAAQEPPVEPVSAELAEFELGLIGATLTGTGAFTFDNSDLETFPGMPRPEGSAEFRLQGGNAVLEKLVQLGMVPEDQIMMVRMMMGMVAKPGPGEDELISEVEVAPDGTLLINGAPLPF